MMRLAYLITSLIFFLSEPPLKCFAAVTTKHATTTVRPAALTRVDVLEQYYECQDKCKPQGEKLECGVNGWWFLNKCHRECEGVKLSTKRDKECNPYEKEEFDHYWKCQVKCDEKPKTPDCGEDGLWYENACRRDCHDVKQADKKLCEKLDKIEECESKCTEKGKKPDCGVDGHYYDNACHRECTGVKHGVDGKDCKKRVNVAKFWYCQEECSEKEKEKEECGKQGVYYYNKCHRECYGDSLGQPGKDCPPAS